MVLTPFIYFALYVSSFYIWGRGFGKAYEEAYGEPPLPQVDSAEAPESGAASQATGPSATGSSGADAGWDSTGTSTGTDSGFTATESNDGDDADDMFGDDEGDDGVGHWDDAGGDDRF